MNRVIFILKNPREFLWEPIRKQLFKARQLRTERDYFQQKLEETETLVADYKQRYEFQYEMRCKAEDERDALAV